MAEMEPSKTIIAIRSIKKHVSMEKKLERVHKFLGASGGVDVGGTELRSGSVLDNTISVPTPSDELKLGYINPVVLNHVFRFLNFTTLQEIREVNRLWDDEASRVLTKRSCIYIHYYYPVENPVRPNLRQFTHADLQDTIQASKYPHRFFVNLVVNSDWILADKDEALDLLDTYGKYLKTLQVVYMLGSNNVADIDSAEGDLAKGLLSGICTILNKSPNLETLNLALLQPSNFVRRPSTYPNRPRFYRELKERRKYSDIVIPKSLNLTTIELECAVTGRLADFCISLIKASPNFCKLRIKEDFKHMDQYRPYSRLGFNQLLERSIITTTFFEILVQHPEIGKFLDDFSWKPLMNYNFNYNCFEKHYYYYRSNRKPISCCHILELISKLDFCPKLKTLRLGRSRDKQNNKNPWNFIQILEKVSGSLEILELNGRYILMSENDEVIPMDFSSLPTEDFPIMKELKVLKIDSENAYGFGNVSVLKKFPKLHTFSIGMKKDGYDESKLAHSILEIDCFLRSWESFQNCPHLHMKRLYLENFIDDPNSLDAIIGSFPNLECLYVGIDGRTKKTCNLSVEDALGTISQINNLKELSVYQAGSNSTEEIHKILGRLNDFKKLENFMLTGSTDNPLRLVSLQKLIDGIKSSKSFGINITLLGCTISKENKMKVREYAKMVGTSFNIHQKKKDFPDIC